MGIFLILRNIGTIISLISGLKGIISSVASKQAPDKAQIKIVLDSLEDMLDKGVIDIPNVDEAAISSALKVIEEKLCS